jgi:hypothetical protein
MGAAGGTRHTALRATAHIPQTRTCHAKKARRTFKFDTSPPEIAA